MEKEEIGTEEKENKRILKWNFNLPCPRESILWNVFNFSNKRFIGICGFLDINYAMPFVGFNKWVWYLNVLSCFIHVYLNCLRFVQFEPIEHNKQSNKHPRKLNAINLSDENLRAHKMSKHLTSKSLKSRLPPTSGNVDLITRAISITIIHDQKVQAHNYEMTWIMTTVLPSPNGTIRKFDYWKRGAKVGLNVYDIKSY